MVRVVRRAARWRVSSEDRSAEWKARLGLRRALARSQAGLQTGGLLTAAECSFDGTAELGGDRSPRRHDSRVRGVLRPGDGE